MCQTCNSMFHEINEIDFVPRKEIAVVALQVCLGSKGGDFFPKVPITKNTFSSSDSFTELHEIKHISRCAETNRNKPCHSERHSNDYCWRTG